MGDTTTTRPTRSRLSPAKRREQLLDLGVKQLSLKRLEDLSIDVLAEVAGISRGLLYHYFSNKRDFHLAILRRMADELITVTAPEGQREPLEQMVVSLEALFDFVGANHKAYLSFVAAAAGGDEEFHRIYEDARGVLTDRIFDKAGAEALAQLGIVDGPAVRLMVHGWSAMVEDVMLAWLADDRGIAHDEVIAMLASALVGSAPRGLIT
jgi:AcrR family transcriptional regulator